MNRLKSFLFFFVNQSKTQHFNPTNLDIIKTIFSFLCSDDISDTDELFIYEHLLINIPEEKFMNCKLSKKVKTINLKYCSGVNDKTVEFISQFKHLIFLDLHGSNITDNGLKLIGKLDNLKSINLDECNITDDGVEHLVNLTKLKCISFWRCNNLTDKTLQY